MISKNQLMPNQTNSSRNSAKSLWRRGTVHTRNDANLPMDWRNSEKTTRSTPNTKQKNAVASKTINSASTGTGAISSTWRGLSGGRSERRRWVHLGWMWRWNWSRQLLKNSQDCWASCFDLFNDILQLSIITSSYHHGLEPKNGGNIQQNYTLPLYSL